LHNIPGAKEKYFIGNTALSEFGALGYEVGFSIESPNALVIWEAQFGDFYNGAQTIVDQYISAAESKWQRMSGLVMLLPHGYEGQGPEHSSARLERFLQQCAEYNMTVANITSPANFFHALRRQIARPFRKPLVVMSPKSLLRHPKCVSSVDELTGKTKFQETLAPELTATEAKKIKKVVICTGKIYYDLLEAQESRSASDTALLRIEQLYPFPKEQVDQFLKKFKSAKLIWAQEEPSNMGASDFVWKNMKDYDLEIIARKASASPATGFKKVHEAQQKDILDRVFA